MGSNLFDDIDPPKAAAPTAPAAKNLFDDIDPPSTAADASASTDYSKTGWGDVATKAIENAPASAKKFGTDIVQPFIHPIDTAKSIGNVAMGAAEKLIPGGEHPHEKYADAVGQYLKDRYATNAGFKKAIAEDPVGVMSDVSMALTGAGGIAARAPGIIGRAGQVAGTVGRAVDPLMAPVTAAKGIGRASAELGTHVGSKAMDKAYRSGVEGGEAGQAFRENMRGDVPIGDVVKTAREGVSDIAQRRSQKYLTDMAELGKIPDVLPWDKVVDAVNKNALVKTFQGVDISPATKTIRDQITKHIDQWGELPPEIYHTPAGFDALKQMIGDLKESQPYGTTPRKVASDAYNAIRQTIVDAAPEYAKTMKDYERASEIIKEMNKTLSLDPKASIDTSLRKLQGIMRNNVNTNYGRRLELGELLEANGAKHLLTKLSGQALNAWFPRGLGKLGAEMGALMVGGHFISPWTLAAAPFMSPRLMGEATHAAGRFIGKPLQKIQQVLGNIPTLTNRGAGNALYRTGRFADQAPLSRVMAEDEKDQGSQKPAAAGFAAGGVVADRKADGAIRMLRAMRAKPKPRLKKKDGGSVTGALRKATANLAEGGRVADFAPREPRGWDAPLPYVSIDSDQYRPGTRIGGGMSVPVGEGRLGLEGHYQRNDQGPPGGGARLTYRRNFAEGGMPGGDTTDFYSGEVLPADGGDWRDQEAKANLAAQGEAPRSWGDTWQGIKDFPARLAQHDPTAPSSETFPILDQSNIVNAGANLIRGGAESIKSGVTAAGRALSGEMPMWDQEGHTSPEAVQGAFDAASLPVGGGVVTGIASAAGKPGAVVAAAEHAPRFYSHLEKTVEGLPFKSGTADQVLGTLKNKGVKAEELEATGTGEFLASKGTEKVTKDELLAHIAQNKIELGQVVKGEAPPWDQLTPEQQYAYIDRQEIRPEAGREWYEDRRTSGELGQDFDPTKFSSEYQLPGGQNYKEKLLTLPEDKQTTAAKARMKEVNARIEKVQDEFDDLHLLEGLEQAPPDIAARRAKLAEEFDALTAERRNFVEPSPGFKSSHWDEPNVLVHTRSNEREVNGVPSHHIEEFQSDWHQKGRKQGYRGVEPTDQEVKDFFKLREGANPADYRQEMMEHRDYKNRSVPDAPFKSNWHELAIKDALADAVAAGKSRISWTPGEAQVARYDLSKQISRVEWDTAPDMTDRGILRAFDHSGHKIIGDKVILAKDLPDHIGKDVAEKLVSQEPKVQKSNGEPIANMRALSGLDLKVGGEFHKKLYDQKVPQVLNKIGKSHGVKVEEGIANPHYHLVDNEGKPGQSFATKQEADDWMRQHPQAAEFWKLKETNFPVRYMDIPQSLRDQILQKGFSLFEDSSAGAPVAAAAHAKAFDKVNQLSGIPAAQAESVMAENAGRGLSFPPEEAADRLRLKLERAKKAEEKGTELPGAPGNPRTVVRAPEGSGLPDFVAGNVTFDDWIARHEKLLNPEEIQKAAKWYSEIYDRFLQQTHGDAAKAQQYMRAWLVGQQNIDVSGAMANALLQKEQIARGVPEGEMIAGGMPNPTVAARRVMQGQPITEGVGQKISDFVDAAEDKNVRSWMGNHPAGGDPFVVDVHTARDAGMVDEELINHLTRLNYNKDDIAKLTKKDLGTSPTQTQYENRAQWGRDLTDHLNSIKWQGRDDWKPSEVQAVGWMGMTRLTANQADDVSAGIRSNMRHLSMELAPGEGSPWDTKYGKRFSALAPETQRELTHKISQGAIERASKIAGVDIRDIVHGTGGWEGYQNPSTVAQAFSSKQGAEIAANALGHLLQQTEVWSNKVKPLTANPKGFAVDLIADGNHNLHTDAGLRDFWSQIRAADPTNNSKSPLFQGYQPLKMPDGRVGIRVLIDRGGAGTKATLEKAVTAVKAMLESTPSGQSFEVMRHEAEIYKARNDWKAQKNGEGYRQRLVDLVGRDRAAKIDTHGRELEKEFRQALEAAEGGKAKRPQAKPERARGGPVRYRAALNTAYNIRRAAR